MATTDIIQSNEPQATVIIVSFNTKDVLRKCLQSTKDAIGNLRIEVIVVDNASKDGSADMVEVEFPKFKLIRSHTNLGFAAANNLGFNLATGEYVILVNPDAILEADTISKSLKMMDIHPEWGLAGGRLIDLYGQDQPSARMFPSLLNEFLVISGMAARFPHSSFFGRFDRTWADVNVAASVDWVPGAFSIIRHHALREVGPFDERFFLYYEEVDLCRRLKAHGWEIWYTPEIPIHHIGGESSKTIENLDFNSSGSQLTLWRMRSALLYYRKHHGAINTWLASRLEISWHRLRQLKLSFNQKSKQNSLKFAESKRIAELMQKAWKETSGGQISPPRPW